MSSLPIKKIYCDTLYKRFDSKSTSDFKIDLPQTIKLPKNCVCYVDDISIPRMFYTVEAGINDMLYFRISDPTFILPEFLRSDHAITIDPSDYTGNQFVAHVKSKMIAVTPNNFQINAVYDNNSRTMSISVSSQDIHFFTDDELKADYLPNIAWQGTDYDHEHTRSANELLTNHDRTMTGNSLIPASFYLNLTPVRNIYMRSPNLSSFNTIGADGSSNIIKKIPVNVASGEMITSFITSSTDFLDISNATLRTIEIQLVDVHGRAINMHGANWSFSLLFDVMNPDQ